MNCELCKKPVRRTGRTSFMDYVKSIIGIYPWRCTHCEKKLYRLQTEQFALVASLCVVGLCVPAVGVAWYKSRHLGPPAKVAAPGPQIRVQIPGVTGPENGMSAPTPGDSAQGPVIYMSSVLHNEDISEMAEAKMGGDVVVRLIRNSAHSFRVDPRSLIRLKKVGTPDEVIREMIEVTSNHGSGEGFQAPQQPQQQPTVEAGEAVEASYVQPYRGQALPGNSLLPLGTRTQAFR